MLEARRSPDEFTYAAMVSVYCGVGHYEAALAQVSAPLTKAVTIPVIIAVTIGITIAVNTAVIAAVNTWCQCTAEWGTTRRHWRRVSAGVTMTVIIYSCHYSCEYGCQYSCRISVSAKLSGGRCYSSCECILHCENRTMCSPIHAITPN